MSTNGKGHNGNSPAESGTAAQLTKKDFMPNQRDVLAFGHESESR
jgi:hypothetical protein